MCNRVVILGLLLLSASPLANAAPEEGFVDLLDGRTTAGWTNPYTWGKVWIENGVVNLQAEKKFFLVTEKPYADFIFEGEVKVPEPPSNSGFMFRCHVEKNRVFGYQAEVDPTTRQWSGGLYDEGRRKWLVPFEGDKAAQAAFVKKTKGAFKNGEWNKYRIQCVGDHLQIWVNGVATVDFHDSVDSQGPIGIQHHGEKGKVYQFRNLRIKELKAAATPGAAAKAALK
jgi:hypothetical protein